VAQEETWKRNIHERSKEKCYSNFMNTLETDDTKRSYDLSLTQYKYFCKAEMYADLLTEKDPVEVKGKIIDWIAHMKAGGISSSSIRTKLAGVQHFYNANDRVLNWTMIKKNSGKKEPQKDRLYTKEEIQRILDKCDERKRVMIFLLLAGLRIGALPHLKIRDLKKRENEGLYQLTVYAGEKEEYTSFATPEGAGVIDEYLDYRRRKGEEITPDAPLLREQFAPEDAAKPKAMSLYSIEATLNRALLDSGVRTKLANSNLRHDVMRFHAFRKMFNTMLQKAGVKPLIKEVLMGHDVGLDKSYLRPGEDELLAEYLKAVDLLTISEEKQLRQQVDTLKTQASDLDFVKKQYLDVKIRLEKAEKGFEGYRKGSKDLLSALATELEKKGYSQNEIVQVIAKALGAVARPSTSAEIEEAKKITEALEG